MTSPPVLLVAEQLRRTVPGGIGTYVRGLLLGLGRRDRAGAATPPLTLYASRPPRGVDSLGALGRALRSSPLPGPVLTRLWDAGVLDVPGGFPVVHATSLAVPPARRAALVVTVHDMAWRRASDAASSRARRWHEAALGRALRRASAFVVPGDPVAAELVAAGAPASAVHVVPHGSDHLPAPDDAAARRLLDALGVHDEFVLSVGTLEPRKNLRRLVEAYAAARPMLPEPWPLVVVGPRGWGGAAAAVPAAAGVVLAGAVPGATLAALYRRARLLAYVPLEEGFGLPPLEAMASGTPVVASPMPSTGDAAVVAEPTDVYDIASAVVRAGTDAALRRRLVALGRARAAALTWEASAEAHVRLWESLS